MIGLFSSFSSSFSDLSSFPSPPYCYFFFFHSITTITAPQQPCGIGTGLGIQVPALRLLSLLGAAEQGVGDLYFWAESNDNTILEMAGMLY